MAQLNRSFSVVSPMKTLAIASAIATGVAVSGAQACYGEMTAPGQPHFYVLDKKYRYNFTFRHDVDSHGRVQQGDSKIAQRIPSVSAIGKRRVKSLISQFELCKEKMVKIAYYTTATYGKVKIMDCKVRTDAETVKAFGRKYVDRELRFAHESCDRWHEVTLPSMKSRKINRGRTSSLSDEWNVMRPATVAASMDMNNVARVGANEAPVQLFRPEDDTKGPALELRIAG